jgi:hypothetical protein
MVEVSVALRAEVRSRAMRRCEYCLVPEDLALVSHEIDHIIAAKHGGASTPDNLALCCTLCNKHKGTDLASIDLETGKLERLFNPRREQWQDHFEFSGDKILARTSIGRVTVRLLQLNRLERIAERNLMLRAGLLLL